MSYSANRRRSKAWSWYRRAKKRGGIAAPMWFEQHKAKREIAADIGTKIFGVNHRAEPVELNGLAGIIESV